MEKKFIIIKIDEVYIIHHIVLIKLFLKTRLKKIKVIESINEWIWSI